MVGYPVGGAPFPDVLLLTHDARQHRAQTEAAQPTAVNTFHVCSLAATMRGAISSRRRLPPTIRSWPRRRPLARLSCACWNAVWNGWAMRLCESRTVTGRFQRRRDGMPGPPSTVAFPAVNRLVAGSSVRRHGKLTPWRHEELTPRDRRKAGIATDMEGARLSAGVGCVGRGDAGAGGGDGDGAFAPIGLGDEADIRRAGVQPQYGEAVPCSGRLDGDSAAAPQAAARRAGGVAGRALSAASRRLRRSAPGSAARARNHRVAAHGGACGVTVAPGAAGRGAGLPAVRDGAGPAAADRFWGHHSGDRRRPDAGASVRGDVGLFAAAVCAGFSARAPIGLVRRHGRRVSALRRGAAGGAVR
jgi:hypothetical protein